LKGYFENWVYNNSGTKGDYEAGVLAGIKKVIEYPFIEGSKIDDNMKLDILKIFRSKNK